MANPSENKTLAALIQLLDEPDEHAYQLIRAQIVLQGWNTMATLEETLENTFNGIVQERIENIIKELNKNKLFVEFSDWLNTHSSDLLAGFMLVTKSLDPSLDEKDVIIRIEQLKVDIWIELNENLTALENVKVMNHLLFDIHHFQGNKSDMNAPHNNCINTLLENKKGSPISLGILFIILAQKLGLPVYGVNLPQHFILAYLTDTGIANPGEEEVLFYINPFNRGAVFTRREIELFIGQMKIKPEKSFFAPCGNHDIIRRLINHLIFAYNQAGENEKIEDLELLLSAFE